MKVGLMASVLSRQESGVEVYVKSLYSQLSALQQVEPYLVCPIRVPGDPFFWPENQIVIPEKKGLLGKYAWEFWSCYRGVRTQVNLLHGTNFSVPLFVSAKLPMVATIHDFAFRKFRHFYSSRARAFFEFSVWNSLRVCKSIICISESCWNDLQAFFGTEASRRAYVVGHGYTDYSKIDADMTILSNLGLTNSSFYLTSGALNPRKNILGAIEAFLKSEAARQSKFVVTGQVLPELNKFRGKASVVFAGHVSRKQLCALYRSAEYLVVSSFYEGFGFPVLEAASVGLPTLCSNQGALPEVSGLPRDLMFDPHVPEAIVAFFNRSASSKTFKSDLLANTLPSLKRYSWEQCGRDTKEIYEAALR